VPATAEFLKHRLTVQSQIKFETVRKRVVQIVFVIYWLLVFEGVLRKWGLPQFQAPLFFVRVPVTLWLYSFVLTKRCWPRTNLPLAVIYVLAIAAVLLIPIQFISGAYDIRYILIAGYGWMNYFFYIPLAFIIAKQFRREDILRLLRHTLWMAILAVPLVIAQFYSSSNSVFNMGSGLDNSDQFHTLGAALGRVRPEGFFTSTLGQTLFLSTIAIAVIYGWLLSDRREVAGRGILVMALLALLTMLVFSGSRGALIQVSLVFLAATIAGIATKRQRLVWRTGLLFFGLPILFILLGMNFFPDAFNVLVVRWTTASYSENNIFWYGIVGRALYGFYAWIYYLNVPLIGYLLGLGGNAAVRLSWVQLPAAAYAWNGYGEWARESSWAVHLVELGLVLGFAYIFFRIWLTVWVLIKAWRGMKRKRDPLPLILFGFAGPLLFIEQITSQGTTTGYTWIFLGLCLAAAREQQDKKG